MERYLETLATLPAGELAWLAIGFGGQAVFASRFLYQWIASERAAATYHERSGTSVLWAVSRSSPTPSTAVIRCSSWGRPQERSFTFGTWFSCIAMTSANPPDARPARDGRTMVLPLPLCRPCVGPSVAESLRWRPGSGGYSWGVPPHVAIRTRRRAPPCARDAECCHRRHSHKS